MVELYRILVVCTGNMCRSPMAEGFLRELSREAGLDHVVVDSAGTFAAEGSKPSTFAVKAAGELGADISEIRSEYLNRQKVEEADLILVMTEDHGIHIRSLFPGDVAARVKLIRTFHPDSPHNREVPDPIGGNLTEYRDAALLLKRCCQGVIDSLKTER